MSDKLVDLEIKLTHLEQTDQELSDVYYQQQKQIDQLQKQVSLLQEQIRQLRDVAAPEILDEKPPHY